MVKSVLVICEDSPLGKNSAIEAIRLTAGLIAMEDLSECKVIFMGDAVNLLNKNLKPEALNMDAFSEMMRLMEFSRLEIYLLKDALETTGLNPSDLISYKNLKIVDYKEISQLILNAEMSFKY
jgi:sulfur relay (sulfurtransferase) DsrF/TusC family protein